MTARTRKPAAAAAKQPTAAAAEDTTTAAAALESTGDACRVPDCIPGLHGDVDDGLCPVHRQTHPGLALSAHARKEIVQADELPLGNGRPGPENSGQDADENKIPTEPGAGDNGDQGDDDEKEETGD